MVLPDHGSFPAAAKVLSDSEAWLLDTPVARVQSKFRCSSQNTDSPPRGCLGSVEDSAKQVAHALAVVRVLHI